MDSIIQHVHTDKKEWAKQLSATDIANILNAFATIPRNIETTYERSDIAAVAGLQGEHAFEKLVSEQLTSDYTITNMSKTSKSGDFIISWISYKSHKTYKMLIDVKNYKTTVPSKEVDKFRRDVEIRGVDCGMLLSLTSKIVGITNAIESKYVSLHNQKIPLVFMRSHLPSAIAEMIKTTFQIIEMSELHTNKINYMDEFISCIDELQDNINMISQCRDTMTITKHEIENSLNNVMLQLMTCEYNLVSNIKKIQKTMANYNEIEEKLSIDDLMLFDTFVESDASDLEKLISYLTTVFNVPKDLEVLLTQILPNLISKYEINLSKKTLCLTISNSTSKSDYIKIKYITIKFMKTMTHIIFESVDNEMIPTITELSKKKIVRATSAGYVMKINEKTVNSIIKLCKLIIN